MIIQRPTKPVVQFKSHNEAARFVAWYTNGISECRALADTIDGLDDLCLAGTELFDVAYKEAVRLLSLNASCPVEE